MTASASSPSVEPGMRLLQQACRLVAVGLLLEAVLAVMVTVATAKVGGSIVTPEGVLRVLLGLGSQWLVAITLLGLGLLDRANANGRAFLWTSLAAAGVLALAVAYLVLASQRVPALPEANVPQHLRGMGGAGLAGLLVAALLAGLGRLASRGD